jgi:hypothetical protein
MPSPIAWLATVDFRALKAAAGRELPAGHPLRQAIWALDDEMPLQRATEAALLIIRMAYSSKP